MTEAVGLKDRPDNIALSTRCADSPLPSGGRVQEADRPSHRVAQQQAPGAYFAGE